MHAHTAHTGVCSNVAAGVSAVRARRARRGDWRTLLLRVDRAGVPVPVDARDAKLIMNNKRNHTNADICFTATDCRQRARTRPVSLRRRRRARTTAAAAATRALAPARLCDSDVKQTHKKEPNKTHITTVATLFAPIEAITRMHEINIASSTTHQ